MRILVTGGAGYIGSHTVVELVAAGHSVVIADHLSNSKLEVLARLTYLTGRKIPFARIDIRDRPALSSLFRDHAFDAVLHFAGHKAVGESVARPLKYYHNNLLSTITLCDVMAEHGVKHLVFSSSATVYGKPTRLPITEGMPLTAANPYGRTKLMNEELLRDVSVAEPGLKTIILRYFNPIGAHESGLIGEDPNGAPNNLVPYVAQVAVGRRPHVLVHGDDYDTHDGTGVRDYIHVVDLARGHVKALERDMGSNPYEIYNLGTGRGASVKEVISAFEKASGKKIPYKVGPRRSGDIDSCYADPSRAARYLGWQAEKTLDHMCQDAWRWQSTNPEGYGIT
jgi:UDP-glucose 4-epimerase